MNVKNLVLGIGIVIVFALALWQGIETFYPSPQWDSYCTSNEIASPIISEKEMPTIENCTAQGGTWTNGYCDYYFECQQQFDTAQDSHAKVAFIISIIVGFLALIVGYSILSTEPVGSALFGSGIWSFFYGTVINWRNFTNIWRFLLLLLALALIIWLAIKLNTTKKKSFWQKIGLKK